MQVCKYIAIDAGKATVLERQRLAVMAYYLGKVGRAGARLVHSCRELYNDVNAAYLTGAVDVLVVRQRDGTLKSTPFHARFGKLGVLRTGDFKEASRHAM